MYTDILQTITNNALFIFFTLSFAYVLIVCSYHYGYQILYSKLGVGVYIKLGPLKTHQKRLEFIRGLETTAIHALIVWGLLRITSGELTTDGVTILIHIVGFTLFYDLGFYFIHRMLHNKYLMKYHAVHHKFSPTTAWACLSTHPVETVLNQLPVVIYAFVFNVSSDTLLLFYIWLIVGTAHGHSNFDPAGSFKNMKWLQSYNRFHQTHHSNGRVNYGFIGVHWDILFGTNERVKRITE